jgi:hypothetical protein
MYFYNQLNFVLLGLLLDLLFKTLRCRRRIPPKRRLTSTLVHSAVSQKIEMLMTIAVRTSVYLLSLTSVVLLVVTGMPSLIFVAGETGVVRAVT